MGLKVTMFFDMGKSGWSESHYWIAGGAPDSIDAQCIALAKARAALLGGGGPILGQGGPVLNYIRVSEDSIFRDSHLVTLNTQVAGPLGMTPSTNVSKWNAAPANLSLKCRGESTPRTRAYFYMSGLPDGILVWNTVVDFSQVGGYQAAFTRFTNQLTAGWGFRAKIAPVSSQVYNVGVEAVQPGRLLVYVVGAVAPPIGGTVQLSGFKMATRANQPLNGRYQVGGVAANVGPPATTVITLNGTAGRNPAAVVKMGRLSIPDYTPVPYTAVYATNISSRKRGVGFGRPVGRRSQAKVYLA